MKKYHVKQPLNKLNQCKLWPDWPLIASKRLTMLTSQT